MEFRIEYEVKQLLFGKANLRFKIRDTLTNRTYHVNHLCGDIKEITQMHFHNIVVLSCIKAAMEMYRSAHDYYYEDKDESEFFSYGVISYYNEGFRHTKIMRLSSKDIDKNNSELMDAVFEVADRINERYKKEIMTLRLGVFHEDIISSLFNGKSLINSAVSDIKNYDGKEPNNETLLCSLV